MDMEPVKSKGGGVIAVMMAVAVCTTLLTGCATRHDPFVDDQAAVPWAQDHPWRQARSAVLDTPQSQNAMALAGIDPDQPQWYDYRNDRRPFVEAPSRTRLVYQDSVTYTHTNLGQSNGHVYNNSYTHSYSRRVEQSGR